MIALKGRDKIAQGIALGLPETATQALTGRNKEFCNVLRTMPPFQGSIGQVAYSPRALPWAILGCPFGAQNST